MNKLLYYLLGIVCALLLTPVLAYLLTLKVSSFEGGRGFAFLYLMPFIFFGLLILFGVEGRILRKRVQQYYKKRNIFSGIVIALVGIGFAIMTIQDQKDQKRLKRNSYKCKQELANQFEGFVVEINDALKMVRIRKSDSKRSIQTYYFQEAQEAFKYGYTGQLVHKNAESEKLLFTGRNGNVREVLIPCYQ